MERGGLLSGGVPASTGSATFGIIPVSRDIILAIPV